MLVGFGSFCVTFAFQLTFDIFVDSLYHFTLRCTMLAKLESSE